MMTDTCGRMSLAPSAHLDPDGLCWRMSQGTLPWADPESLQRLPDWGMTHGGALFALPTPAHLTEGRASSSSQHLPTPVADHSCGLPQPGTDYASLPNVAVALLPTPTVGNATGTNNARGGDRSGELLLPGVVLTLLPTPKSTNNENRQNLDQYGMNLGQALGIAPLTSAPTPPPSDAGNTS